MFVCSQQISFADDMSEFLKNSLKENMSPINSSLIAQEINNTTVIKINSENYALKDKIRNIELLSSFQEQDIPQGIIYREDQRTFDALDPKKENDKISYYPGLRGPNQLIVYTPNYGPRTGTNEFGTEAIIRNNMVVELNGADSIIPKDGFVISGHGSAKAWITNAIQVGSKVYLDYGTNTIKAYLIPESLMYAAKQKLTEVNDLIEHYKKIDILYNDKKAAEYLEFSKEALRKAEEKPEKTQSYINEAMDSLNLAIKNAIPYKDSELKGVWIRPTEKSVYKIEKTLDRIQSAGITDVFLETYFHGKTIYPSEYLNKCGIISQREEFVGFDPLQIWIEEAHKRGMKIHVWFEAFYVGNDNPKTTPNHILSVYPLWGNKRLMNYDSPEPVSSLSEHNGYFLDPANIQVQEHLMSLIKEIVENYKPDGINLDYIRYPQTVDPTFSNYAEMNWGYTKVARDEFISIYGIDPINIKHGTGDWELWSMYRQSQISRFVKNVKKITKKEGITLTAVVFPDLQKSISTKMQNWKLWSINNYVDGLTPLILTGDKNTADLLIQDVVKNTSSMTNIYPGIFVTFMGGPFDNLLVQIHKTRKFNTEGAILFDYAHLNDNYIDALTTRVFNKSYDPRDIRQKEETKYEHKVKLNKKEKKRKKKNKKK